MESRDGVVEPSGGSSGHVAGVVGDRWARVFRSFGTSR